VGRKKRFEVFFILYLMAIVVLAVLSKERDRFDSELRQRTENIVRTLLAPVPISLENDTLFVFVDAAGTADVIRAGVRPFVTTLTLTDIGPEDDVRISLSSILRDNVLISPQAVRILGRRAVGSLEERTVVFPVECTFTRKGTYSLRFTTETKRVREHIPGFYTFRGTVFSDSLIPPSVLRGAETAIRTLTVVVEDTSIAVPLPVDPIEVSFSRDAVTTALGFEEDNPITITQAFLDPDIRLVKGAGHIDRQNTGAALPLYSWRGIATKRLDSIVVQSRVHRQAGGKDISRTSFVLRAVPPFLRQAPPEVLYAGEDLFASIAVDGLDNEALYSWQLFEIVSTGAVARKDSGVGPVIRYHIPNNFVGKTMRVLGHYKGRPYRCITRVSYSGSPAVFDMPVVEPPLQIALTLPATVTAAQVFQFTAMRYSSPRYANDWPVASLQDLHISMMKEDGTAIRVIPEAIAKGRFRFMIADRSAISPSGNRVVLTIRSKSETVTRRFTVYGSGL
jgi:hypothetical protein